MAFTVITVGERYLTAELTPATGTVRFTPVKPMINGDFVVAAPRSATLDAEGDITIELAANNDPSTTPAGVSYRVDERIDGQPNRSYYVVIPHDAAGGAVQLSDLVIAEVPPLITFPTPGPQGPQGDPGPNTIGTADDLDATSPAVGQVIAVSGTSPLTFDLVDAAAGGGAVDSVNGETGVVVLDAADVGADPAGTAAAAVVAHEAASDPHPQYLTAAEGAAAFQTLDGDLTTIAGLAPADGSLMRRVAGAWSTSTVAQVKTDLALTKSDVGLGSVDNVSAASLRDRSTHTGSQAISTVTNLQTALDGKAPTPNIQVFTSSGTWNKPAGATKVTVYLIAGGGGGGAGARQPSGTATSGGAGGGGGGFNHQIFRAADLGASEDVVVGTGGAGGPPQTTNASNGAAGSAGTASSFGTVIRLRAGNGFGGTGGNTGAAASGGGGNGVSPIINGGAGAVGAAGANGGSTGAAGAGGGAGGGLTATPTAAAGGLGGGTSHLGSGVGSGTAGTAGGGTGGDGLDSPLANVATAGGGGGGGGSHASGVGGTGGEGGNYGAGGGGGGSSINGNNSGAGGAGGDGIVIVISE